MGTSSLTFLSPSHPFLSGLPGMIFTILQLSRRAHRLLYTSTMNPAGHHHFGQEARQPDKHESFKSSHSKRKTLMVRLPMKLLPQKIASAQTLPLHASSCEALNSSDPCISEDSFAELVPFRCLFAA